MLQQISSAVAEIDDPAEHVGPGSRATSPWLDRISKTNRWRHREGVEQELATPRAHFPEQAHWDQLAAETDRKLEQGEQPGLTELAFILALLRHDEDRALSFLPEINTTHTPQSGGFFTSIIRAYTHTGSDYDELDSIIELAWLQDGMPALQKAAYEYFIQWIERTGNEHYGDLPDLPNSTRAHTSKKKSIASSLRPTRTSPPTICLSRCKRPPTRPCDAKI